jgi:hypothetical protein
MRSEGHTDLTADAPYSVLRSTFFVGGFRDREGTQKLAARIG